MAQVPNSSLYAYQDGLVVTAAQLNQDIQVLQTALNDNYYRLLRSVTVNGTAYQLQGTSGIINNVNLNTDSTVSATSSSNSQGNITVTFSVASGAISSSKIANGAVGTAQIANQAVTQALIANQAVGTPQIANYAVGVNQLDPTLVQQTSINLVQAKLAEAVLGLRNLLHPSQQSFTRASSAWRINGSAYVPSNVLRTEQGKFGQGAFIEESTTNLVPNSGFENVTTTATVFSDALTSYTGSTVPAPWALQSGSFTFGASGATSGATNSFMTAGNAVWRPILGSDGTTKLALTSQATFTTPSTIVADNGYAALQVDNNNKYYAIVNNAQIGIHKVSNGTDTTVASVAFTPSGSTSYVVSLMLDNTGLLTTHVKTGGTDVTGSPLTYTDSSPLTGGFLIGVGGDTGVVISNASCVGPWANSWSIGGDSRVAWGLTQSAIGGKYSVSAVGVGSGVLATCYNTNLVSVSSSSNYTQSIYVSSSNVGSGGVYQQIAWYNSSSSYISASNGKVLTGSNTATRDSVPATSPNTATQMHVIFNVNDSGTVTFDNIQLEQKPYATTYVEVTSAASNATATRNADSLSYNLSNPLPSSWFGALVWKPNLSSTQLQARANQELLLTIHNSSFTNERYRVEWNQGTLNLFKFNPSQITASIPNITFNANDLVFIALEINPANNSISLYYSVNGGAVQSATTADSVALTDAQTVHLGCYSSTGYEANGTIDFPIISDVIPTSDQITALANATDWGGMRDWVGSYLSVDGIGSVSIPKDLTIKPSATTANSWSNALYFQYLDANAQLQQRTLHSDGVGALRYTIPSVIDTTIVQALSGGYKVQSGQTGTITCAASSGTAFTITFPSSFTNPPFALLTPATGNANGLFVSIVATSTTQISGYVYNTSSAQNINIDWLAIGQ